MHITTKYGKAAEISCVKSGISGTDHYKAILLHNDAIVRVADGTICCPAPCVICLGRSETADFDCDARYQVVNFTPKFLNVNFTHDYLEGEYKSDDEIHIWLNLQPFFDRAAYPDGVIQLYPYTYKRITRDFDAISLQLEPDTQIAWSCCARNMLMEVIDLCNHATPSRSCMDPTAAKMLDYVHGNYNTGITSDSAAEHLGLSKREFDIYFKIVTGINLPQYINSMRISMACKSLAYTGLSVHRIAMDLGYYDQSHFSRTFKTAKGMTPEQYRAWAVPDRKKYFGQGSSK